MENYIIDNRVIWFSVLYSVLKFVPYLKPLPDTGFRGQFKFFKSLAPWLLILAVIMGNGGIFVCTVI